VVTLLYALRLMTMRAQIVGRFFLANLFFALGIGTVSVAQVRSGPRLDLLTLHSNIFGNTRTIRVWLPAGYDDASQSKSDYPIIYFTDGIATFHGRHLDATASQLIKSGKIPAIIFVGIDNGGSTLESKNPLSDRTNEYLPYPDDSFIPAIPTPHGNQFPDFLEQEVRPLVESRYRIRRSAIGLAGASYGAAIVLYTVLERPGKYRWLLLESPSVYVDNDHLLRRAAQFHHWPQRVYIGAGTREGKSESKQEMVDDVKRLAGAIGHVSTTCVFIAPGAEHGEDAWRARLPTALRFLVGADACPKSHKNDVANCSCITVGR
jgi:predicted alpha/beta superfamily hydrolase